MTLWVIATSTMQLCLTTWATTIAAPGMCSVICSAALGLPPACHQQARILRCPAVDPHIFRHAFRTGLNVLPELPPERGGLPVPSLIL